MAIEHKIMSTDTLRTLAQFYLNNSNLWQSIADFNGLNYPYIVDDDRDRKNLVHGNGYVLMKRTNFRTARTVRSGWQLVTTIDVFSGQVKIFEVTEDVVFPEGVAEAYVHIRAKVQGVYGNLPENTSLKASNGFDANGFQLEACTTIQHFSGGQDVRVLTIGEYIYIPQETQETIYTDRERVIAFVGEEDLALDKDGDLYVDSVGDIASVKGADNIVQAINHRLMTERGSLKLHPKYGSNIHYLIGQEQSVYRLKMIELDIYETLSYEDRITDLTVHQVDVVGTIVYITTTFRLKTIGRSIERNFMLDYKGLQPA